MQDHPQNEETGITAPAISAGRRALYLCLGCLMLLLGIIGALLPVMPTTIFIILAAWFFARSSPKLEARLLADPRFGPLIVKWRERGAIPPRAKFFACLGMAVGYGLFWWGAQPGPLLAVLVTIFMLGSAAYVLSRPSE
ncbi:YbaN family protein [Ochrobactrum sp. CM-21-5]|nr:YbaN family protein [Ochrobactrum sp. CM-21-5]MBC2884027.1 YbaN family protein [Ochrobactrum sp. CM-21-5]